MAPLSDQQLEVCPQCFAHVPSSDGPVHAYVSSAPGCWATFGQVQADELERFGYPAGHRLVVDAYMAQHPGNGLDRRDRQSVFLHLVGLCAVLELGFPAERVAPLFRAILGRRADFPLLRRGGGAGTLTITHMRGAEDLAAYGARASEWAGAVWSSWEDHHGLIRAELATVVR